MRSLATFRTAEIMADHQTLKQIDALLEAADRLHSAPTIALKIVEITRDPNFEVGEVVACLEHDPALAARSCGL